MAQQQNSNECAFICWGIAGVAGFLSMFLLYWMGGFSALQAIFCGGVIGFVLGLVLSLFICRGQTAAADLASEATKPAQRYAAKAAAKRRDPSEVRKAGTAGVNADATTAARPGADKTAPAGTMAAVSNASSEAFAVKPSKELPGQKELAERKGEWKYEKQEVATPAADVPGGVPAEADAAAPPADAANAGAPDGAEESKPALMEGPRDGGKDDLKLISGVGPKLEETLNSLGIWHFEQVAAWGPEEIAWVDNRLRFKGRIQRDDWMSQAKILAEGGETEFSRKKQKKT
ncbi:endonuclease [Sulfitobacter sp. HNIBRBA3233]|uniref:endonuclease n=1 Tax=Sulfitobacter marinivivus TaxID=3158558 RepID=UPI0032DEEFE4